MHVPLSGVRVPFMVSSRLVVYLQGICIPFMVSSRLAVYFFMLINNAVKSVPVVFFYIIFSGFEMVGAFELVRSLRNVAKSLLLNAR